MLILARKVGEEIVIGDGESQVVVLVTEICGDKVRLGIEARRSVPIHRREVYQAIQTERRDPREAP